MSKQVSNFIKRDLADKAEKRGSKLERLLDEFGQSAERDALRAERREEAQEEREPAPRALPAGFRFRRRIN